MSVIATGTITPTVGAGETTLYSESSAKVYTLMLDTSNMTYGDSIEIRCRIRVLPQASGGVAKLVYIHQYVNVQSIPVKMSIAIPSPYYIEFTFKQTTGTARSFDWMVLE